MKINGDSGSRFTVALMLDYNFNNRADVYVEADYTTLIGTWRTLRRAADLCYAVLRP